MYLCQIVSISFEIFLYFHTWTSMIVRYMLMTVYYSLWQVTIYRLMIVRRALLDTHVMVHMLKCVQLAHTVHWHRIAALTVHKVWYTICEGKLWVEELFRAIDAVTKLAYNYLTIILSLKMEGQLPNIFVMLFNFNWVLISCSRFANGMCGVGCLFPNQEFLPLEVGSIQEKLR